MVFHRHHQTICVLVLLCLAALLITNVLFHLHLEPPPGQHRDAGGGCRAGHFKTATMKECAPWLSCAHIRSQVRPLKLVGQGAMKQVDDVFPRLRFHSFHSFPSSPE